MNDVVKPFRWNLTRRNELGRLTSGERTRTYDAFSDQLLTCCVRVLALSGDSDLIFVGRSPESIFDHLSGLLFNSSWFDRLELLHFSIGIRDDSVTNQEEPKATKAMRAYLRRLELHPEAIATKPRNVALVDLVSSGTTFGRLIALFQEWCEDTKFDWNAVRRRIRLVGITKRTETSPKTWRWQQHATWLPLLAKGAVKNISIPRELWEYLGDYQEKVSPSYTPARWGDLALSAPSYSDEQMRALRLAFDLFELGRQPERKEQFTSLLVKQTAMKEAWFRTLVQEIRSKGSETQKPSR